MKLDRYASNHSVRAAKVIGIEVATPECADESNVVYLKLETGNTVTVSREWAKLHEACVGGYYVVHENGCRTFVFAEWFESRFNKVEETDNESW